MITKSHLLCFTPEDLIILYIGFYNQEFGNKKAAEVLSKIINSKKIQEFITRLRIEKLSPGEDGFITVVNSIPYFFFSKGETLCYGALFAIQQWLTQISNDTFQLSQNLIHHIVVETIFRAERTKINSSINKSFFNRFYILLEDTLEKSFNNQSE